MHEDFLLQCDPSKLEIEFLHTIEESNLRQRYSMACNVYCTGNEFILTGQTYMTQMKNKKELRKFVAIAKRAKKKGIKLIRVDNSLGFTRLIYGFS